MQPNLRDGLRPSGRLSTRLFVAALFSLVGAACSEHGAMMPLAPKSPQLQVAVSPETTEVRRMAADLISRGIRDFAEVSDSVLWRFIQASDSLASVGVRSPGSKVGFERGRWLTSPADWVAGQRAVSGIPGVTTVRVDTLIPTLRVKIGSFSALQHLRGLPFVSYLEPGRQIDLQLHSGCGEDAFAGAYSLTASGDVLPNTFKWMNIDKAWHFADGRGVKIGLVDTGVDGGQPELGSLFASGQSAGRTIEHGNSAVDNCSHGTRTAGVITAPMNGEHVVGVAWAANLFSFRHGDGVIADAWGAANGVDAAGAAGARVIQMAFGTGLRYADLGDRITYWYYNHDVVFIGAAGTWSACFVTNSNNVAYPAEKEEVIAVSPSHHDGGRPCAAAYGPQLDLIAFHQQPTTARGSYGSGPVSIEQSSNASAVVAGVAALVRQRFPTADRYQVRDRLLNTAGGACGIHNAWHRIVNAEAAVGGLCWSKYIGGPPKIIWDQYDPDYKDVEYWVEPSGGKGPTEIRWSNGTIGPRAIYRWWRGNWTGTVSVEVRDTGIPFPAYFSFVTVTGEDWANPDPCPDPTQIDCLE